MPPTFLLIVTALLISSFAPVILILALGCLFFNRTRVYATRLLLSGIGGGLVFITIFFVLSLFAKVSIDTKLIDMVVVSFGTGFTLFALIGALMLFLSNRRTFEAKDDD